jgi:hypothetical protein
MKRVLGNIQSRLLNGYGVDLTFRAIGMPRASRSLPLHIPLPDQRAALCAFMLIVLAFFPLEI